jgi:beta-glucanase (GH16 family)
MKHFLPVIAILGFLYLAVGSCSKKGSSSPVTPPVDTTPVAVLPYKLVWSDEFDTGSAPDPKRWAYDIGGNGWGNSESQYYTNRTENARIENGNLVIEARKEAYLGSAYTSARLLTKNRAAWTYGRFEIRAKLPTGRGTWPAIWMLSDHNPLTWPDDGELDIMEEVGFDPNVIHATIHCKQYYGGNGKGFATTIPSAQDSFHVYKMEWTSSQTDFYVDDNKYFSYFNGGNGPATWPYYNDFFMILNIAVGGTWGGTKGIDDTVFPQKMLVDYVRVYQRK